MSFLRISSLVVLSGAFLSSSSVFAETVSPIVGGESALITLGGDVQSKSFAEIRPRPSLDLNLWSGSPVREVAEIDGYTNENQLKFSIIGNDLSLLTKGDTGHQIQFEVGIGVGGAPTQWASEGSEANRSVLVVNNEFTNLLNATNTSLTPGYMKATRSMYIRFAPNANYRSGRYTGGVNVQVESVE